MARQPAQTERYHPIPVPAWWPEAATAAAKVSGMLQSEIAERCGRLLPSVPSISAVSRCLSGETTTVELCQALSIVLGVPPPVFIASSKHEAVVFLHERLMLAQSAQAAVIAAKQSQQPKASQTDMVRHDTDGDRGIRQDQRGRGRVDRSRPKTP